MKILNEHEFEGRMPRCPSCGQMFDACAGATISSRTHPEPGDFCACVYCGAFARFIPRRIGPGLRLRQITPGERDLIETELRLKKAMAEVACEQYREELVRRFLLDTDNDEVFAL